MVSRVLKANASGEMELPTPTFAVLLVQLTGAAPPTGALSTRANGQLVLDAALSSGHVFPLKAEGSVRLSGAVANSTWLVAVAQDEWEATVLR